jgi:predicted nucleic acid-binding protein
LRRILLDLNVALDVLLERPPHARTSASLWARALVEGVAVVFPAHGVTTVSCIAARQRGPAVARRVVTDLMEVAEIAPTDAATLRQALALGWPDYEDAVCAVSAERTGCDVLVSRDPHGFRDCSTLVVDPITALSMMGGPGGASSVSEAGPSRPPRKTRPLDKQRKVEERRNVGIARRRLSSRR